MNPFRTPWVFACFAPLLSPLAAQSDEGREIRWEEHSTMGADGKPLEGRIGRILVPENRSLENDKTIEIAFVRYRTTNPEPRPPLFFFAGGPGGSGIEGCLGPATGRLVRLLDYCDVIGVDQRGTGLSRPNLSDMPDFGYELPLDRAITRADVISAEKESVARMVDHWIEEGVDLAAYNSAESADDIDDVRAALGIEKIMTLGSSYGSHLSLAYLRRHAEHVDRSMIWRVEGPDHTWKLPSQVQDQLERLHELVAADPGVAEQIPDFLGVVRELLGKLEEEPVVVTLNEEQANEVTVTCGPYDLQRGLASLLADRGRLAQAPIFLHGLLLGDWTLLGDLAVSHRRGGPYSAMTWMMDCASGASPARLERYEKERKDQENLLGDAFDGYYLEVCSALPDADLGEEYRGPMDCDVPVLFVSGSLDARTPPSNVEEIQEGFSDFAHVLVENVGHTPYELPLSEEYREIFRAFVLGGAVESQAITLPRIEFRPIR